MIAQIAANNRAGGWRKLKRDPARVAKSVNPSRLSVD
jgi:hypothetical protein